MRRTAVAASIVLLSSVGIGLDSGVAGLTDALLWAIAYMNFLLFGCILGWVLARLTPGWEPPAFVWRRFDFFTRPADREGSGRG